MHGLNYRTAVERMHVRKTYVAGYQNRSARKHLHGLALLNPQLNALRPLVTSSCPIHTHCADPLADGVP